MVFRGICLVSDGGRLALTHQSRDLWFEDSRAAGWAGSTLRGCGFRDPYTDVPGGRGICASC